MSASAVRIFINDVRKTAFHVNVSKMKPAKSSNKETARALTENTSGTNNISYLYK